MIRGKSIEGLMLGKVALGQVFLRVLPFFSGEKRPGRGVNPPPSAHLVSWLKKEYSCTSITPVGLHGLF